jgi:hypothetical protein
LVIAKRPVKKDRIHLGRHGQRLQVQVHLDQAGTQLLDPVVGSFLQGLLEEPRKGSALLACQDVIVRCVQVGDGRCAGRAAGSSKGFFDGFKHMSAEVAGSTLRHDGADPLGKLCETLLAQAEARQS